MKIWYCSHVGYSVQSVLVWLRVGAVIVSRWGKKMLGSLSGS